MITKNQSNQAEIFLTMLETNLKTVRGELYKLEHDSLKRAGIEARKSLINMYKVCKPFRKLIVEMVKSLEPRHKWSKESINSMLEKKGLKPKSSK